MYHENQILFSPELYSYRFVAQGESDVIFKINIQPLTDLMMFVKDQWFVSITDHMKYVSFKLEHDWNEIFQPILILVSENIKFSSPGLRL